MGRIAFRASRRRLSGRRPSQPLRGPARLLPRHGSQPALALAPRGGRCGTLTAAPRRPHSETAGGAGGCACAERGRGGRARCGRREHAGRREAEAARGRGPGRRAGAASGRAGRGLARGLRPAAAAAWAGQRGPAGGGLCCSAWRRPVWEARCLPRCAALTGEETLLRKNTYWLLVLRKEGNGACQF